MLGTENLKTGSGVPDGDFPPAFGRLEQGRARGEATHLPIGVSRCLGVLWLDRSLRCVGSVPAKAA